MNPTWESGDVQLYLGDCLEVLPTLEDGSVDAVITDPPYGIGFKYSTHDDTSKGYGKWIWNIIKQAECKCNPGSPLFVWQAMPCVTHFAQWFPRNWRIFAAAKNFVQMRPGCPMQYSFDPVLVWWTEGETWTAATANRDFHIANTSPSARKKLGTHVEGHPCPRPLDQITHIVGQWARPEGVVLDLFMGSGTTGVACVKTGRKFIGIEIDPNYFEIAVKRIQEAQMQPRLEGLDA